MMNNADNILNFSINNIIAQLRKKQVIAYPTESVFGLGCDPDSQQAVISLLQLKQRSWQKGLILIAADYQQLTPYIDDSQLTQPQKQQLADTWPGPITWLLPANVSTPTWLTGEFTSLAVRVSNHPLVKKLCQTYGKPLVSTSANLSGLPPCRSAVEVRQQFGEDFPILDGELGGRLNPSEIRDIITGRLIRQG